MPKPNYIIENYCSTCGKIFSKAIIRCPTCHFLLRTRPNTGIRNKKYLELKHRY